MSTTRDQLITKTCELLELQGYHATGLNQIIKESGTPKGSLYYHFPGGKEELATTAIARIGDLVLKRIQDNLAQVEHPADAIEQLIRTIAHSVELSDYRAGGPLTSVAMEAIATSEALRDECSRIYRAWQMAFADKLKQGGFTEARADQMSVLIIASIEGAVILCRTSRSRDPLDSIAREIGNLIRI